MKLTDEQIRDVLAAHQIAINALGKQVCDLYNRLEAKA